MLRLAERYLPLREVGKAAFLIALDVARFAARRHRRRGIGREEDVAEPDDVFAFTVPEIVRGLDGARGDVREVAARRQAKRVRSQKLSFPDRWEGVPQPRIGTTRGVDVQAGDTITGVSVTGGVVEGAARVATSLDVAERLRTGRDPGLRGDRPELVHAVPPCRRNGRRHRRAP